MGSAQPDGRVYIGSYGLGESPAAWWQLWASADRLAHGLVIGDPDDGALNLLGAVGLGARDQGVEVWFVDPAYGASCPVLAAVADRVLAPESGDGQRVLVDEVERELVVRCRATAVMTNPDRAAEAGQRRPLLLVVAEAEEAFDDYLFRRTCEKVARYGGRVRIGLTIGVRSASNAAFGGGVGLRYALLAENVATTYSVIPDPLDDEPLPWLEDVDLELSPGQAFIGYRGWLDRPMPFTITSPDLPSPVGFSARDRAQQSGPGAGTAEAATGRTPERRSDP